MGERNQSFLQPADVAGDEVSHGRLKSLTRSHVALFDLRLHLLIQKLHSVLVEVSHCELCAVHFVEVRYREERVRHRTEHSNHCRSEEKRGDVIDRAQCLQAPFEDNLPMRAARAVGLCGQIGVHVMEELITPLKEKSEHSHDASLVIGAVAGLCD